LLNSFHRQVLVVPLQHSTLEIRDVLEAEAYQDGGGRSASYSGAADDDAALRVFSQARR
jgi:hypothetical protein